MDKNRLKIFTILSALILMMVAFSLDAYARAGGGRSMGSRGSRSYSRPASPASPSRQQAAPQPAPRPMTPPPFQPQPAGGGFMRSLAGGMIGGMLGGMLFRSLGFGGGMGMGGGGIGLFDILLIGGLLYLVYRVVRGRRQAAQNQDQQQIYGQESYRYQEPQQRATVTDLYPQESGLETGISNIRQMDASFSEERFRDQAMDLFFKVQGAWMNRDLAPAGGILTEEMRRLLQGDVDKLLRDKRVNRLENIAVRDVELVEAWQESGQDFITTRIYANLLDYTTDDQTGAVVEGSKTEPVKFEEYWTFTRPVGNNPWKLSAIEQL